MDLKNHRELAKLVSFCRKSGVTSLKSGDFEIQLAPAALFPESAYKKKKSEVDVGNPLIEIENAYSEEDALFWSSSQMADELNSEAVN
jgi:hypothetical protein